MAYSIELDGVELATIHHMTPAQRLGLSYSATGYGSKIPTEYMVLHNNRIKRVYVCIWSNVGTLFIMSKGKQLVVVSYS